MTRFGCRPPAARANKNCNWFVQQGAESVAVGWRLKFAVFLGLFFSLAVIMAIVIYFGYFGYMKERRRIMSETVGNR